MFISSLFVRWSLTEVIYLLLWFQTNGCRCVHECVCDPLPFSGRLQWRKRGGGCNVEPFYTVCTPLLSIYRLLHHYSTCLSITALFTQGVQLNHLTGCPTNVLGQVTFCEISLFPPQYVYFVFFCQINANELIFS